MPQAGMTGIHRRRGRGCTRRDPAAEPADDLVKRAFDPSEPNRLRMMDVTEHPTGDGKVYLAVVLVPGPRRPSGGRCRGRPCGRCRRREGPVNI
jgi:putative transposase